MNGAGDALVADRGLNRSATTDCPFWVGIFMDSTLTAPPDVWIHDDNQLAAKAMISEASSKRLPADFRPAAGKFMCWSTGVLHRVSKNTKFQRDWEKSI